MMMNTETKIKYSDSHDRMGLSDHFTIRPCIQESVLYLRLGPRITTGLRIPCTSGVFFLPLFLQSLGAVHCFVLLGGIARRSPSGLR